MALALNPIYHLNFRQIKTTLEEHLEWENRREEEDFLFKFNMTLDRMKKKLINIGAIKEPDYYQFF